MSESLGGYIIRTDRLDRSGWWVPSLEIMAFNRAVIAGVFL
jgi:hypothetical protein